MSKLIVLDLFCKAGGATKGYQEAGFYVVGVDIEPQPNYCGDEFVQADAIDVMINLLSGAAIEGYYLDDFSIIHASPPCQAYAEVAQSRKRKDHPELLEPVRDMLRLSERPWVLENVPPAPMPDSFILCGSTFDLPIIRHRRFEVYPRIDTPTNPKCPQKKFNRAVSHGPGFYPYARKSWGPNWGKYVLPVVWPWMTMAESGQAIPPAYTKFIAQQLINLGAV